MEHFLLSGQENELLQRKPLKEELFEVLQNRIITGKYAPGDWLRQEDISSQFGVSQTPVREALDLLVSAGLAERVPYRGVRVLQLSKNEMVDAYVMRLALEGFAAHLAALNASQSQIDALYSILAETQSLQSLTKMARLRQLNREFHMAIVVASGNFLLQKLFDVVSNAFPDWMLYEAMFHHPELLKSSLSKEYSEHLEIVNAIAAHSPQAASQKVSHHIYNLGSDYETFLNIPKDVIEKAEGQIKSFLY